VLDLTNAIGLGSTAFGNSVWLNQQLLSERLTFAPVIGDDP